MRSAGSRGDPENLFRSQNRRLKDGIASKSKPRSPFFGPKSGGWNFGPAMGDPQSRHLVEGYAPGRPSLLGITIRHRSSSRRAGGSALGMSVGPEGRAGAARSLERGFRFCNVRSGLGFGRHLLPPAPISSDKASLSIPGRHVALPEIGAGGTNVCPLGAPISQTTVALDLWPLLGEHPHRRVHSPSEAL